VFPRGLTGIQNKHTRRQRRTSPSVISDGRWGPSRAQAGRLALQLGTSQGRSSLTPTAKWFPREAPETLSQSPRPPCSSAVGPATRAPVPRCSHSQAGCGAGGTAGSEPAARPPAPVQTRRGWRPRPAQGPLLASPAGFAQGHDGSTAARGTGATPRATRKTTGNRRPCHSSSPNICVNPSLSTICPNLTVKYNTSALS